MKPSLEDTLLAAIRTIPDYPKPGILFRDITTLLSDARAFRRAIDELVHPYAGQKVDKIAGIEARGFILGGAVAHQLSAGFVPIRKKGKLPYETVRIAYSLEYGLDEMEMHRDGVSPGEKVILIDDLIATGGTAAAAVQLLRQIGADIIAACFVIDLPDLGGREKLEGLGVPVNADRVRRALRECSAFSPCGRRWIGAQRRDGRGCWTECCRCQAGAPLIRPSFARPPSPTRGEGRSYPTFTSTALSNSMTLSPVESKASERSVSTRQPGRDAMGRWASAVRVKVTVSPA
ncbi:adenine phosphoribosyltransferase (modular protein) [Mesorhizobium escarrei]|uniref:Adenine phosphoribosyltransferase n=1 Tax=Mesorhizobium escarrei TaxID=666018 RepID=A0ABN8JHE4_9HYPH|nr:adenine phosphoribosyltransferase (modular protein) [Mesorhizobium escarrei]